MPRRRDPGIVGPIDVTRAQIALDRAPLLGRRRKQMNMNLVGAEPRATQTNLREIERR